MNNNDNIIIMEIILWFERFYCSCFKCWGFSNKVFLKKIKSLKKKKKKNLHKYIKKKKKKILCVCFQI